ncbi:MAG: hypothetical protein R3C18_05660 [Planctomycetaceae bacterium]
MDWSAADLDRLYKLYRMRFDETRHAVVLANRTHGSSEPEKTRMQPLEKSEFVDLVNSPKAPDVARRWILRIIRGHEKEFPGLRVA